MTIDKDTLRGFLTFCIILAVCGAFLAASLAYFWHFDVRHWMGH